MSKIENSLRTKNGFLFEQRFVLKAIEEGFKVSQPLYGQEVYDFILDYNGKLNRIQVKSTQKFDENCKRYNITASKSNGEIYTKNEIDFMIVVVPCAYYIVPVEELSGRSLRIYEKSTRKLSNTTTGKFDKYLEKWDLLK